MTGSHIDQLTEWWNEATPGIPKTGDTYIEDERHRGRSFRIVKAPTDHKYGFDNIRILARAPKPKPAWHDAVAVIAHTDDGHIRQVWERDGDTGYWCGTEGYIARTEKLRDATPLIEAKVTDEMMDVALAAYYGDSFTKDGGYSEEERSDMRRAVTAALGLETE